MLAITLITKQLGLTTLLLSCGWLFSLSFWSVSTTSYSVDTVSHSDKQFFSITVGDAGRNQRRIPMQAAADGNHSREIFEHRTDDYRDDRRHKTMTASAAVPYSATTEFTRRNMMVSSVASVITGISTSLVLFRVDKASAENNIRPGGMPNKILSLCFIMDELQRDLMQERWDLVTLYPAQLRSFVPLLTTYTDAAFPTDEPTDSSLRVELRYEVGRFFSAVERLRKATGRKALGDAYTAYADMAIHFDLYLRRGDLYTYERSVVDLSKYYEDVKDASLVYADPKRDPPKVRDLVVLIAGPDKGKTGILIGINPDGSGNRVVKLDKFKQVYSIREIRVVKQGWVAKRIGEQDPDEVFLLPRKTPKLIIS